MKILISEAQFQKIITEFDITTHFKQRMGLRFLNQDTYDVVAYPKYGGYNKMIIGKFNIPNDTRNTVQGVFDKITHPEYTIPQNIALVIQLCEFKIKLEYISFNGNPQEQQRYKRIFGDKQNWNIYLQSLPDEKGKLSHGRFLICIARGNVISTAFLLRDTTVGAEELKRHMLIDFPTLTDVIFIGDPETQLDNVVKSLNMSVPKELPKTPEDAPRMSDKERLDRYKERMSQQLRKK
jgi:hypothetical protein